MATADTPLNPIVGEAVFGQGFRSVLLFDSETPPRLFGASLDTAARFRERGATVTSRFVDAEFAEWRPQGRWGRWNDPKIAELGYRSVAGLDLPGRYSWRIDRLPRRRLRASRTSDASTTTGDGQDFDQAVRSSLVWHRGRPGLDDSADFTQAARTAGATYSLALRTIDEVQPDVVVFLNGRFVVSGAVRRAAESRSIPWISLESMHHPDAYRVALNGTPHDFAFWRAHANRSTIVCDDRDVEREWGRLVSEGRRFNDVPRPMGESFDVVYFSSTWAEYAFTPYQNFIPWESEPDAFTALARACDKHGASIALRLHPNMTRFGSMEFVQWNDRLRGLERVRVLDPDSRADSIELLRGAGIVATGFSTVGIQAALLGKPLVVLGSAPYADLVGAMQPRSDTELAAVLAGPRASKPHGAAAYIKIRDDIGIPYRWIAPPQPAPRPLGMRVEAALRFPVRTSRTALSRLRGDVRSGRGG